MSIFSPPAQKLQLPKEKSEADKIIDHYLTALSVILVVSFAVFVFLT